MLLHIISAIFPLILSAHAYTGDATYFAPGLGACGEQNTGNDMIVAIAARFFDSYPGATPNPNLNPICNKKLTAHAGSASVTVKITDRCAGCPGGYDLDLSPAAFQRLADLSVGRLHNVEWTLDSAGAQEMIVEPTAPVHAVSPDLEETQDAEMSKMSMDSAGAEQMILKSTENVHGMSPDQAKAQDAETSETSTRSVDSTGAEEMVSGSTDSMHAVSSDLGDTQTKDAEKLM